MAFLDYIQKYRKVHISAYIDDYRDRRDRMHFRLLDFRYM